MRWTRAAASCNGKMQKGRTAGRRPFHGDGRASGEGGPQRLGRDDADAADGIAVCRPGRLRSASPNGVDGRSVFPPRRGRAGAVAAATAALGLGRQSLLRGDDCIDVRVHCGRIRWIFCARGRVWELCGSGVIRMVTDVTLFIPTPASHARNGGDVHIRLMHRCAIRLWQMAG